MTQSVRTWRWVLLGLLFLIGAGRRDWWYPDEPDVALPVIEMATRGDWVIPTHNGAAWLDYPPLAYWGARLTGLVTGKITPFSTRLPMLVFAAAMLWVTWRLGIEVGRQDEARLAAVVLAGSPLLWYVAANVQTDLGYATAQALGLWFYWRGAERDMKGWPALGWRAIGFGCFGMAILGKGPLGLLLPGLVLVLWHAWNREWRLLGQLIPLSLVALAVALPWYVLLGPRIGWPKLGEELYLQNFDRFNTTSRGHGGKGWWYYAKALLLDFSPWIFLLLPAGYRGWKHRRHERGWRLLALWVVAPLAFFTLASTKRNVYLLPVYPAMAVMVAEWLQIEGRGWTRRWRRWTSGMWGTLWLVLGLLLATVSIGWPLLAPLAGEALDKYPGLMGGLRPGLMLVGAAMAATGAGTLWIRRQGSVRIWSWLGFGGALTAGIALNAILPVIDAYKSYQPAASWLVERVDAEAAIGFFWPGREATKRPAWLCHLQGRRLKFFATALEAQAWLAAEPGRLLLTHPELLAELPGTDPVADWQISSTHWVVVEQPPIRP